MQIGNWTIFILLLFVLVGVSTQELYAQTVTIIDYDGVEVRMEVPAERIVCLSTALNEILWAIGAADKVVGIDANTQFPGIFDSALVVGKSSASPQVEAILELNPDVIFADTMMKDDMRKKIETFGIPVIVERTSDPNRLYQSIRNVAQVVNQEQVGEELITFIDSYSNLIYERLKDLKEEERVRLYWEWNKPYKTGNAKASVDPRIQATGGINICHDAEGYYPIVSAEYVWQQNPEVIIKMANRGDSKEVMKGYWDEINTRPGLKNTSAVQNQKIYIISWEVHNGLKAVIGDLYYAKWSHPERFVDIHPEEIHRQLNVKFFKLNTLNEVVYPGEE